MIPVRALALCALGFGSASLAVAQIDKPGRLHAGAGVSDISPPPGTVDAGANYADPESVTGNQDRFFLKACVLEIDRERLAHCSPGTPRERRRHVDGLAPTPFLPQDSSVPGFAPRS